MESVCDLRRGDALECQLIVGRGCFAAEVGWRRAGQSVTDPRDEGEGAAGDLDLVTIAERSCGADQRDPADTGTVAAAQVAQPPPAAIPTHFGVPPARLVAPDGNRVARSAADDRRLIRGQTQDVRPTSAAANNKEGALGLRES